MANIKLSYINGGDYCTLSGGSWIAGAPLANLQNRIMSKVARSTNALATSTRFDVDTADASFYARLIAVCNHNCSQDATYRITVGTTVGGADIYDSGTQPIWPAVYLPEDLEWESPNWWTGQLLASEVAGYPIHLFHDCGSNVTGRYWRVQITDTANAAGYVQAGRFWLGTLWSPTYNIGAGPTLTWEAASESKKSLGGVRYFDHRPSRRVYAFQLPNLLDAEGFGVQLEIQRLVGSDGEIVVLPDTADASRRVKRDMIGTLRRMDPLTQFATGWQSAGYEVEESL